MGTKPVLVRVTEDLRGFAILLTKCLVDEGEGNVRNSDVNPVQFRLVEAVDNTLCSFSGNQQPIGIDGSRGDVASYLIVD